MKSRIPLLVLVVVSLALLVALLATRRQATEQSAQKDSLITHHSNEWQKTSIALEEVRHERAGLERDLSVLTTNYSSLSNSYQSTTGLLATTKNTLAETAAALQAAEAKIANLEGENQALDKQTTDLNASLTALTVQIEETRQQLEVAQGDKAMLQAELEKLMAEKAELERQLNDLEVLKDQIHKIRAELAIERRLDWIRRGILGTEEKGATRQMQTARDSVGTGPKTSDEPKYDLNVEILEDGTVRVLSPATNAPAAPAAAP
ncbi:MAG: hypothetical protein MUE94_01845 [Verrucomicrobia bacterium]|jgi:chromosome segregation ATPase|nr:hypothetical protein [Verrucomicrobiota bacterium]